MYFCYVYNDIVVFIAGHPIIAQKALEAGVSPVVIDNTNTTIEEMMPYVKMVNVHLLFCFVHLKVLVCSIGSAYFYSRWYSMHCDFIVLFVSDNMLPTCHFIE